MSLESLGNANSLGNLVKLAAVLTELQGLKFTVVDGAAAGTKMNVAAMRAEDTIHLALKLDDVWAAPTDDKANITIQPTKASGTITIAGNPVADETVTVNGVVYTWKAAGALTDRRHVKITAGDNTAMAAALAAAINGYENRVETALTGDANHSGTIVATSALGVVTVTAVADGTAGNSITLVEASTNVTVSGATLAGGTATGGIKSTTDLSTSTLLLVWSDKR